tara:strand:+ start:3281 stop:3460 length:180 start_codon:yes stop_codon:yes gene_type:complete
MSNVSLKDKFGRVYTDTVESVAIIDGDNIVENVSYQEIIGNKKKGDISLKINELSRFLF